MAGKIDKLSGLCVITGASSGIGLELTKLAARDGCDLILAADRDLGAAEATARPKPLTRSKLRIYSASRPKPLCAIRGGLRP